MHIDTGLLQATEFDKMIVIHNYGDNVQRPGAIPLAAAPPAELGEYLVRYLHARAHGKSWEAAHKQALVGAVVVEKL